MHCAVITGDLIASTSSSPEAVTEAMSLIEARAQEIGPETRFTRHRGDGWQIYLQAPGIGLRTMVSFAADLTAAGGLQSHMALGMGTASNLNGGTLSKASGSAFVASGRALDEMPKVRRMEIAGDRVDDMHRCLVRYIDLQVQNWSREQAEASSHMLTLTVPARQVILAARLGITRQAFAARLAAAGYDLLDEATNAFFSTFGNTANANA